MLWVCVLCGLRVSCDSLVRRALESRGEGCSGYRKGCFAILGAGILIDVLKLV